MDRRVPQIVGLYVAGGWGFLQFVDWVVEQYQLSPDLVNFVVTLLLLLLPTVIWLAWRHGAPGRDGWGLRDGIVIGSNLIVAGGVLIFAFAGRELGAATTVKLVEDAEGNVVERVVPKAAFRTSVLAFPFEDETGDPDRAWLADALELGLSLDVVQDPFVAARYVTRRTERDLLAEAGLPPGASAPLPVRQRAARDRGVDYFLGAEVRAQGDSIVAITRLYETRSARLVAERVYRDPDPLAIVDSVSIDLRRDLGVPEWQIESAVDFPVREMLTESPEALRSLTETEQAFFQNDLRAALAAARHAIAADSTAAFAHMFATILSWQLGDIDGARESRKALDRYAWRLPERVRLQNRMFTDLLLENDPEAARRTGSYWSEVYPQDPEARRMLANIADMLGDRETQIEQLRALLSIDPTDVDAMAQLGAAYSATDRYDSAQAVLARRDERLSGTVNSRRRVARVYLDRGDVDAFRAEIEEARVAAPDDVSLVLDLGWADIRQGRYDEAESRVEEARALARTDWDRWRAERLAAKIANDRGQYSPLEQAYRSWTRLAAAIGSPRQILEWAAGSALLWNASEWNRGDFALAQIDSLGALLGQPLSGALGGPEFLVHLERGDLSAARTAIARLEAAFEAEAGDPFSIEGDVLVAKGWLAEREDGSCERALPYFDEVREMWPGNAGVLRHRARCLRELGRLDEAGEDLDRLLALWGGDPEARVEAARYALARGDRSEARAHLDAALSVWAEADPEFRPAREA
ncbi:MAG: tetratricopeptide repeat protein, partial [marine benthic group bacterium]|nr:tetratricopeptide repeat protein [Gemmatimonadota bacterium]